jgi:hypothetical protein
MRGSPNRTHKGSDSDSMSVGRPYTISPRYTSTDQVPPTPESLPTLSTRNRLSEIPPEAPMPIHDSPVASHSPYSTPSRYPAVAEGHLPLLNQVLQNAKRWIDWDHKLDPTSSPTTPIWDAYGRMSRALMCQGRGNTKKTAKNDAARALIKELQRRLGNQSCTTADLAKELEKMYNEKQVRALLCGTHEPTQLTLT